MFALLALVRGDTPATCYDDQVLGTWEVRLTKFSEGYEDGRLECAGKTDFAETRTVTLRAPNVAVDERGQYGTWTFGYTNAIHVAVGDLDMLFYFDYFDNPSNPGEVVTNCSRSAAGMGWAHRDGMTRPTHACLEAENVAPVLNETLNYNGRPEPGPVNPDSVITLEDGRTYRLQPRKLRQRVFFGPALERQRRESGAANVAKLSSVPYSGEKLPDNFDWRNVNGKSYVPPAFDQQSCGSCYVCATTYMMMSRIMVQNKTPGVYPRLSIQHALDCNQYSQGCDGGFGEHVGRFAEDTGLLTVEDYGNYTATVGACRGGDFPDA